MAFFSHYNCKHVYFLFYSVYFFLVHSFFFFRLQCDSLKSCIRKKFIFSFLWYLWSLFFILSPFCSGYDFGYLIKILTNSNLPEEELDFFEILRLFFPVIYDVKYLMKSCKNLKVRLRMSLSVISTVFFQNGWLTYKVLGWDIDLNPIFKFYVKCGYIIWLFDSFFA